MASLGGAIKGAGGLATKLGTGAIKTGTGIVKLADTGLNVGDKGVSALIRLLVKGGRGTMPEGVKKVMRSNETWKKLVAALRNAANSSAVRKTGLGVGGLGGLSALLSSIPDEGYQPMVGGQFTDEGYSPFQGGGYYLDNGRSQQDGFLGGTPEGEFPDGMLR
jgi:hypothetical protein